MSMITEPPEHLIEAAIKAATVVTSQHSGEGAAQQFAANAANGFPVHRPPSLVSHSETITTTQYLNRKMAIDVVRAVLKAIAELGEGQ